MKILVSLLVVVFLIMAAFWFPNPLKRAEQTPVSEGDSESTLGGQTLDLSGKNLDKIPNSVFSQTDLKQLDVSNNQLSGAIQGEIRFLRNLRSLDASNNLFTGVPAEIGQLSSLEILNLSNNQLTGLPYELGNLQNLKVLNLSGNSYLQTDLEIIKKQLPAGVQIITE